jgi:hypothetical protein
LTSASSSLIRTSAQSRSATISTTSCVVQTRFLALSVCCLTTAAGSRLSPRS